VSAEPEPIAIAASNHDRDTVSRRFGRITVWSIVLVVLVGTAATTALLTVAKRVDRLSTGLGPASDANGAALIYMLDAETGIRGYALTGSRASLQPYLDNVDKIVPRIDAIGRALHRIGEHDLDRAIARERRLAMAWIEAVRPAVVGAGSARRIIETQAAKGRFDAFRRASHEVGASIDASRSTQRDQTQRLSGDVFPIIIIGGVLALLVGAVLAVRSARGVSQPLIAAGDVARRLQAGDLSACADESAGPVEVQLISTAVNSLGAERRLARAVRESEAELRTGARGLTSAIRIGQDPDAVATSLVAGLGRVFAAELVWLVTFTDSRVPTLSSRWQRGHDDDPEPIPATTSELLRRLAERLWHEGTVLGVSDHLDEHAVAEHDHLQTIEAAEQAREAHLGDVRASMIAALGESGSAMGLIWIATLDEPREWTATELGLVQHIAAELSQNLVQRHLLAQQRAAMRRLREADEAKSALVSTVSHELRTPLTSIIGYLDVLLDGDSGDLSPEVAQMLQVVERNAVRLRGLIEDLLTQSEIEAGRRHTVLNRVDIAEVLGDVEDTIRPLADNAGVELEIAGPDRGALVVDGDGRQLGQALINLAANAVKFTPGGGRVCLRADRDAGRAVLRVSDTGIGIPKADVPHLFERFFRASNARSAAIPGTGLGLAIVAETVASHDGSVRAESELGKGTTFVIELPLAPD
jgi:signal transduction histidine kinase